MGQLPQQATVVNILDSFHDNMGPMLSTPTPPEAPKRALPWSASCLMLTVVPSPATLKGKPSSWWSDHFGENDRGTINIKILDRSDSTVTEVKVGQKSFNTVDEFCYLGGTIPAKSFWSMLALSAGLQKSWQHLLTSHEDWNTWDVRLSSNLHYCCTTVRLGQQNGGRSGNFIVFICCSFIKLQGSTGKTGWQILRYWTHGIEGHILEACLHWSGFVAWMQFPCMIVFD